MYYRKEGTNLEFTKHGGGAGRCRVKKKKSTLKGLRNI